MIKITTTRVDSIGRRITPNQPDATASWSKHGPGPGHWVEHAACTGQPLELFFPPDVDKGRWLRNQNETITKAKQICATCPVQPQCFTHALTNHEIGIWGGTTENEREDWRRGNQR